MRTKQETAIQNNHDIYTAVFRARDIPYEETDTTWHSFYKAPPLYSNIVTSTEDARPFELIRNIEAKCIEENWGGWSIKDSFNILSLEEYGLRKLFDATWIYLSASSFIPASHAPSYTYKIIDTPEAFNAWRDAWDAAEPEPLCRKIYLDTLLSNPDIKFIAAYEGTALRSGCILNRTDEVWGISNFFGQTGDQGEWSAMISFIMSNFGSVDIVGYERHAFYSAELAALGFDAVGDLSVWIR